MCAALSKFVGEWRVWSIHPPMNLLSPYKIKKALTGPYYLLLKRCIKCNLKVQKIFGHEFHIPKQGKNVDSKGL
jgi:hypothetical protein